MTRALTDGKVQNNLFQTELVSRHCQIRRAFGQHLHSGSPYTKNRRGGFQDIMQYVGRGVINFDASTSGAVDVQHTSKKIIDVVQTAFDNMGIFKNHLAGFFALHHFLRVLGHKG